MENLTAIAFPLAYLIVVTYLSWRVWKKQHELH